MQVTDREQIKGIMSWGAFGNKAPSNPYFEVGSIIIVGGLFHEGGNDALGCYDLTKLMHVVGELIKQGIKFSDCPDVSVCNLEYGDDFVRDAPQADCLLFAWVNKGVNNPRDRGIGGESDLLKKGHTWEQAISRSNSPLVTMITDNFTCVGADDVPPEYRRINTNDDAMGDRTLIHCHEGIQLGINKLTL